MSETGLVVARFRRHVHVEGTDGERYLCRLQGRRLRPVAGDRVSWRRETDGSATVQTVLPRSSALKRIDARGRPETIAAHLSQLVIVLAHHPAPDWFLLDRYLAAGVLADLNNTIVFNKVDLTDTLPSALRLYETLGYPVLAVSAREGTGLEPLQAAMAGERSVMIGQSGVGKSSLINVLMGDALQKVGALSEKALKGRHTTTTAVLHRLPGDGELIDSPGVRDYAPFIAHTREVQRGFRELCVRSPDCRFDNCSHLVEPGCAVRTAVTEGEISPLRYESFRRLYELTEAFRARRG